MGYFIIKIILRYEGDWKNFKREGKGILYHNNAIVYNGNWKNDIPEGKGNFIFLMVINMKVILKMVE